MCDTICDETPNSSLWSMCDTMCNAITTCLFWLVMWCNNISSLFYIWTYVFYVFVLLACYWKYLIFVLMEYNNFSKKYNTRKHIAGVQISFCWRTWPSPEKILLANRSIATGGQTRKPEALDYRWRAKVSYASGNGSYRWRTNCTPAVPVTTGGTTLAYACPPAVVKYRTPVVGYFLLVQGSLLDGSHLRWLGKAGVGASIGVCTDRTCCSCI